ncbi:MAG TPA: polysaccharide deacetylase family protein [Solirubrobacteraceae bacterium]|nr:polysaccharide deacetylase family protein [Solirubrobacteraceae bacterium]
MTGRPDRRSGVGPVSGTALARRRAGARRRAQIRRRRAVALLAATIALIAIVLIASGGGGASRARQQATSAATGHAVSSRARRARATHAQLDRENAAIDRLLARQPFITAGGSERREIALTFDDGPGPYTPGVLDQLQRLHAPATFFEVGFMIHYFYDSLERQVRTGAVIGDHTEQHPMMARLTASDQNNQIVTQTQQLHRYGAPYPRLYRPPYGSFNAATFAILHRLHMLMVLWSVDTDDYLRPGASTIVARALAGAKPGAIILMHDAGGERSQTIAALPPLVHALRARGYKLVTIPQLVLDDPPEGHQPTPTSLAGD